MTSIANKIDEQLNSTVNSVCLPSLPSQVFHKPVFLMVLNMYRCPMYSALMQKCQRKPLHLIVSLSHLLMSCSNICGDLLLKLANLSLTEGIFPEQFKLGQVTPIPKKHGLAVDDPSNYRPITNLCTFG